MEAKSEFLPTTSQMTESQQTEPAYLQSSLTSPQQYSPATSLSPTINNTCQWKGCYQKYDSTKDLFEHVKEHHVGRKRNGHVNLQCFWSDCKAEFPKVF